MTDVVGSAVGWVEGGAAFDELGEFMLEGSQLLLSFANFGEFVGEECFDVAAWGGAVVAEFDHASDLGQGEAGGLGGPDEEELVECGVVVGAVAVDRTWWCCEQSTFFVVADGVGWDLRGCCEVSDAHGPEISA